MVDATVRSPRPANEPVLSYAPGSPERATLKATLAEMAEETRDIPMVIGGAAVHTADVRDAVMPHDHESVIGRYAAGTAEHMNDAIEAAMSAREHWTRTTFRERAAIFLRAAELLRGRFRPLINASTMLGQSKTAHQAEIDAACELVDFFQFNVLYAEELLAEQPESGPGMWDMLDHRPLDGFVLAVTPFNFTSIAANLCTAPAMMGNTVVWKPSLASMHSAQIILDLLEAAGLPPGVINMVTGDPAELVGAAVGHADFAGLHYTGSTKVFRHLWQTIGNNIGNYRAYPRIVGETGGKDFIVAHPSAIHDLDALKVAIVRGGYEFQGQKCSAASRVYVPASIWAELEGPLVEEIGRIKMGDIRDFTNFMGAVIHAGAFDRCAEYIAHAKAEEGAEILAGGGTDKSKGYFVEPTLVKVSDPRSRLIREEIFGPIVTVYVYEDAEWSELLTEVDSATEYGLTGAVWARDRSAIEEALSTLRHAAGNFYINDKPTGAVVGQQPFGGSRASGTNDKAGSALNLTRWTSPRTIKETFVPPTSVGYPFMGES